MRNRKFLRFLNLFVCCFLFSLCFFSSNVIGFYSAQAEENLVDSQQVEDSNLLSPDLLRYVDGAIANGARTFDFFNSSYNSDSDIVYGEWLILYDLQFYKLDNGGIIDKFYTESYRLKNGSYTSNSGIGFDMYTSPSGNYTQLQCTSPTVSTTSDKPFLSPAVTYSSRPSIVSDFDNFDYSSFLGGMFFFPAGEYFCNGMSALNYKASFSNVTYMLNGNSYSFASYLGYDSSSQILFYELAPYVEALFVPLSDVINYAYTNGFKLGEEKSSINGAFNGAVYDVDFTFANESDRSDTKSYRLTNVPVVMKNGFTDFSNLLRYELVQFVDGVPEPYDSNLDLDVYMWEEAVVTVTLGYPIYYSSPYIGAYSFSPLVGIDMYIRTGTDSYNWYGSDINDTGRFPVPISNGVNVLGNVYKIRFGTGFRASDIIPGIEFRDYSGLNTEAYNTGYIDGKADGFNDGFDAGKDDGYKFGFNSGYNVGLSENNSFYSLITAVIDVPVKAFTSMFNFEILNVNLLTFVYSIITVLIVVWVLRFFIIR